MTSPATPLRVLFLMGQSRHDVLRNATRELAATFAEAGHAVSTIDLTAEGGFEELATVLNETRADLVVAYQAWGLGILDSGPNIFARAGVPYVTILGDDIMYHTKRLRSASDGCAVLVMGPAQIDAAQRALGPRIPVGVFSRAPAAPARSAPPLCERAIELLFLGSVTDPAEGRDELFARWPQYRRVLDDLLQAASAGTFETTEQAAAAALARRGYDSCAVDHAKFTEWVERIDRIERSRRRIAFVEGVVHTKVTLWGEGWDRVALGANASVKSSGFATGAAAARQAKLLLNIFPDRSFGSHDRCELAVAHACVLVSESTPTLEFNLQGLGFAPRFRTAAELDRIASELLANEVQAESCVREQFRYVAAFARDTAVQCVLNLAEQARLLNPTKFHPNTRF